jgi:hypothetical protein
MKILTEKEQLQQKIGELHRIKMDILTEKELLLKRKRKEIDKVNNWLFSNPNWLLVNELDERINKLYNAANAIDEYRCEIINRLNNNKP